MSDQPQQRAPNRYWGLADGVNKIRLMPPRPNHDDFYVRVGFHYGIGPDAKMFPCPRIAGVGDCYLCGEAERFMHSEDEDDIVAAQGLFPTRRFLVTVVDLQKPQEGFKVWPVGVKLFREMLYYFADPAYGDVTDLETGYDFTVTRKGSGLDTEYRIRCAKKPTNFLEQYRRDYPDEVWRNLPNLEEFLDYTSAADMEAEYSGHLTS